MDTSTPLFPPPTDQAPSPIPPPAATGSPPPPPPGPASPSSTDEGRLPPLPAASSRAPAAVSFVIASSGAERVEELLRERVTLTARLGELDAEQERVARAVQRIGGAGAATTRPFTGAHPVRVGDAAQLDTEIRTRQDQMKDLTASISKHELELLDLERGPRHPWLALLAVLFVLAAVAAGIYVAVR